MTLDLLLKLPSAVQSTSATNPMSLPSHSVASFSQSAAILLQCPHHGAKNLMKTVLPSVIVS